MNDTNSSPASSGEDFSKSHHLIPKKYLFSFILLASCFMWWGLANNMTDPLVKVFMSIFPELSTFQSSLIQFAFYGGYFCLAIPGAIIARKFSYKAGVLVGLGMYAGGCLLLLPASLSLTFYSFLIAFWVLAAGLSILETNANPYILSLGSPETATQRLNLAQAFNPLGSIVGTLLAALMILKNLEPWANPSKEEGAKAFSIATDQQAEALDIVILPYLIVAGILAVVWLAILLTRMPKAAEPDHKVHFGETFGRLFKNSNYVFAVVAQFFYVGAQITVWTYTFFYIPNQLDWVSEADVLLKWHIWALVAFGSSRFVFTFLMKFFKDYTLLMFAALVSSVLTILVVAVGGVVGSVALIAISAFMSLMFPTIFGLGCRGLGTDTKVGSSGLIMAILGGAILTPLQAWVIDISNVQLSYLVPLTCFIVIGLFARYTGKVEITDDQVVKA
jgi:FHS family L-fucose permease-like MFS transporter